MSYTQKNNRRGGKNLWEVRDVFVALMVVIVLQVHTYLQTHPVLYVKYAQIFACQSHLNKMVLKKIPSVVICQAVLHHR